MNHEDMKRWRADLGFSAAEAAAELGVSVSVLQKYELPFRHLRFGEKRPIPIPLAIALACAARTSHVRRVALSAKCVMMGAADHDQETSGAPDPGGRRPRNA